MKQEEAHPRPDTALVTNLINLMINLMIHLMINIMINLMINLMTNHKIILSHSHSTTKPSSEAKE